jgi:hypothetical protein
MHGFLRAAGGHAGQLAGEADFETVADVTGSGGVAVGADWFRAERIVVAGETQ